MDTSRWFKQVGSATGKAKMYKMYLPLGIALNPDKIFLQNHVTQIFISVSYLESNLESIVSNLPIRMLPESHYLHSGYFGPVRRSWQSDGRDEVSKSEASTFLFVFCNAHY